MVQDSWSDSELQTAGNTSVRKESKRRALHVAQSPADSSCGVQRTLNVLHDSEEFVACQRGITGFERIAAGDDLWRVTQDAMDEDALVPYERHDGAFCHVRWRAGFDCQDVARPDRRFHASAHDLQPGQPVLAYGLREQQAFLPLARVKYFAAVAYDFLRLNRHEDCVGPVLPQASAMVSKTFSDRNSGFT